MKLDKKDEKKEYGFKKQPPILQIKNIKQK